MGPALSREHGTIVVPYGNGGNTQPSSKTFSERELKIMKKYLSSFVYKTKSTETHRRIVSSHWDLVFNSTKGGNKNQTNGRVTELYDIFFSSLDDHSPELKHVFRSSMQVRGKVLVHISIGMRTLLSSDKLAERIMSLTQTHRRFGVKVEYFNAVGLALIHALKETSASHWSPEIEDAWQRLFSHSGVILIAAQLKSDKKKKVGGLEMSKAFLAKAGPSVTTFTGDIQRTGRNFFSKSANWNSVRDSSQTTTIVTVATNSRWAGSVSSTRGPSPHSRREAESTDRPREFPKSATKNPRKTR